jgi:membrane associated rhomboid family serine protease
VDRAATLQRGTIAYTDESVNQGGVAYMAHIGGFFAGLALTFLFRRMGGARPTA